MRFLGEQPYAIFQNGIYKKNTPNKGQIIGIETPPTYLPATPKASLSAVQVSHRLQNTAILAATSRSIMYCPSLCRTNIPSFDFDDSSVSGATALMSVEGLEARPDEEIEVVDGGLNSITERSDDCCGMELTTGG